MTESASDRFGAVMSRVTAACERSRRDPSEVTLIGASKSQPLDRMRAAWEAGLRVFGENRVQEALGKMDQLPPEVEWHFIGPLQSNKARKVVPRFVAVHSIDRTKIAMVLDGEARKQGARLQGYLEINLGGEPTKHGFEPATLLDRAAPIADLEGLEIVGLMAIPPFEPEIEQMRGWFRKLRQLRDELCSRAEWAGCPGYLSMGMSYDFEVAVEEGATHIRVGTALFGPRPQTDIDRGKGE
ncbi:MAG: YggS family pyridoxal phosphate-dependent enzyme [Acidobacteria bacterium]|nr:MAG: YggS family pyridoxal phosphate-dependent enzyme [Acidobacteriota bacterium]